MPNYSADVVERINQQRDRIERNIQNAIDQGIQPRDDLSASMFDHIFFSTGDVSVDIETTGLHTLKGDKMHVIIFNSGDRFEIVRVPQDKATLQNEGVLSNTKYVLTEKRISKTFHHAPFDLGFIINELNIKPSNIYCTRMLAKVLGEVKQSLKDLVYKFVGLDLPKGFAISDWSGELSCDQVRYALEDVAYLKLLFELERDELLKVDRSLWDLYLSACRYLPAKVELEIKHGLSNVFIR